MNMSTVQKIKLQCDVFINDFDNLTVVSHLINFKNSHFLNFLFSLLHILPANFSNLNACQCLCHQKLLIKGTLPLEDTLLFPFSALPLHKQHINEGTLKGDIRPSNCCYALE